MRETGKITWELECELRALGEAVAAMMEGEVEHQRVTLRLPKALVYFALYRAIFQQGKGGKEFWRMVVDGGFDPKDKLCVAHRNRLLEETLCFFLAAEFNSFAARSHPILFSHEDDEE